MAGLPCLAVQSSVLSQRRNLARKGGNGTVASVCAKLARVCWSKRKIAHSYWYPAVVAKRLNSWNAYKQVRPVRCEADK
jgi:hypothetical protein